VQLNACQHHGFASLERLQHPLVPVIHMPPKHVSPAIRQCDLDDFLYHRVVAMPRKTTAIVMRFALRCHDYDDQTGFATAAHFDVRCRRGVRVFEQYLAVRRIELFRQKSAHAAHDEIVLGRHVRPEFDCAHFTNAPVYELMSFQLGVFPAQVFLSRHGP